MNATPDKARVLVVDDERANLTTLHALLQDTYKVMVATNAEQGLRAAVTGRPDLILLDVTMPDMSGFELCQRLRADPVTREIPVIFITALTEAADETLGLELGAVDYITKPFNLDVVRARVRTHVRLKQQSDLLAGLAFKDGLTGLNNRRAFDDRLATEWRRSARLGNALSVVLLDVDHFKLYNDHRGHAEGDDCLRAVARSLAEAANRPADFVARYGGEEFVVILPDTDLAGGVLVAERLRHAVAALGIAHPASRTAPHVTVSLGLGTSASAAGASAEALLVHADRMLYRAKEGGRNRVEAAVLTVAE